MNKKANHNSIIFLTTLSVYLGLVLVGGTAPVLAHSALTRGFDIKNEIVFEDDLDKKPDDDDLYVPSLVELVNEINKFSEKSGLKWHRLLGFRSGEFSFSKTDNSPYSLDQPSEAESIFIIELPPYQEQFYDRTNERFVSIARNLFTESTTLGLGDFHSHEFVYELNFNKKNLEIKSRIKNGNGNNAQVFANSLTSYLTYNYLSYKVLNTKSAKEKIVAENTKITFENDQVFIVTRLPRGSIDALLAEKDAQ